MLPRRLTAATFATMLLLAAGARGQDLDDFEQRLTVHRLANGWTFLLLPRPTAPVFSFATIVNAGSVQEVAGITGLAHMFEHMAFKGTPNLGTTDYEAEKKALAAVEAAYLAWQAERLSTHPDETKLAKLESEFKARQAEASSYVIKNEFGDAVDREGGVGLNASTAADTTQYFYSLPSNKLELFCYLESERFLHPVYREFYTERDVVKEERRLRVDSNPIGRLVEQFLGSAYLAHPYGVPGIGHMSDLNSITATDAEAFFRTYYVPSNIVTAIVGDIDPKTLIPMLETYFGRIPSGPKPNELRTQEPAQIAERTVTIVDPAQPLYLEAYHKPADTDADQVVYDAIDDILGRDRTGRLYRTLVRDRQLAAVIQTGNGFPGSKYPNLWLAFVLPVPGAPLDEIAAAVHAEQSRLASEEITDVELSGFKTRARAALLRGLEDNAGLAFQLAYAQTLTGDWRDLFLKLRRIEAVTKADIQRVAKSTFRPENRTVGRMLTAQPDAAPANASTSEGGQR